MYTKILENRSIESSVCQTESKAKDNSNILYLVKNG